MVDLIDTIVYAGRLKDKSALMSSSSGGAFTALSDAFLKSGDAVVAAVYNYENHTVEFQMILDEKQRERAKGSKYMQSKPGDIYQEAYRWLMDNPKKGKNCSLLAWDVNQMDFGSSVKLKESVIGCIS